MLTSKYSYQIRNRASAILVDPTHVLQQAFRAACRPDTKRTRRVERRTTLNLKTLAPPTLKNIGIHNSSNDGLVSPTNVLVPWTSRRPTTSNNYASLSNNQSPSHPLQLGSKLPIRPHRRVLFGLIQIGCFAQEVLTTVLRCHSAPQRPTPRPNPRNHLHRSSPPQTSAVHSATSP